MNSNLNTADFLSERRLTNGARGNDRACYELGIAYSTGTSGVVLDLIEAHKWFNLAAMSGNVAAQECRAEISEEMTAREISIAQRAARDWLQLTQSRAA